MSVHFTFKDLKKISVLGDYMIKVQERSTK